MVFRNPLVSLSELALPFGSSQRQLFIQPDQGGHAAHNCSIELLSTDSTDTNSSLILLAADTVELIGTIDLSLGKVLSAPAIGWTYAALWSDIGAPYAGAGWATGIDGFTHLKGVVSPAAGAGSVIATGVPAPHDGRNHFFAAVDVSTSGFVAVEVTSAGAVQLLSGITTGHGYSLDGISFYTT